MKAKKDNKVYRIVEAQKKRYLADGYDIYDDEGSLLEYSPLKKVEYSKYVALKKEIEELKAKIVELETSGNHKGKSLSKMNKGELIAKAKEMGLEATEDMTIDTIVALIKENESR